MPARKPIQLSRFELCASVDAFIADYEASAPKKTIAFYRDHVGRVLRSYLVDLGITALEDVTPDILRRYMIAQANHTYTIGRYTRKVSQATLCSRHQAAKRFFGWCVERKMLTANPMSEVRAPQPSRASRLGYTPEEVTRLLTHAGAAWDWLGARDKAIVTLLVGTGIRAEGLLGMTVDSILWAHGNRQIVVREKGSKERRVTLGEKAARAVKDYLRVRPQVESNALWLTFRRSAMTYGTLNAMLKHLGEYAGVENVIPHRFRHTFAYQHYQRHKDIKAIQNALGHERVETTDKYLRSLGINYGSELETPDAWLA